MPKILVNEDDYIAALNEHLRRHPDYQPGMAFLPSPEGATGRAITGYTTAGPFELIWVYSAVAHDVVDAYALKS